MSAIGRNLLTEKHTQYSQANVKHFELNELFKFNFSDKRFES